MSAVLLVTALGLLAFPAITRRAGRRLAPAEWTRLAGWALLTGVVALELAFVFLGMPTVLELVGVHGLATACRRFLGELAPGGVSIGSSAALLAVALPIALTRAGRRAGRAAENMRVEAWLGEHVPRDEFELVLLPIEAPVAYSVAGEPGQVVVSRGLADALTTMQLDAVLRHEMAHLQHRHQRWLVALGAVEGAVPVLRPSTAAVRGGLERWADEDAAAPSPAARRSVREALVRTLSVIAVEPAVAAFGTLATLNDRLDALAAGAPTPGPARRIVTYLPPGAFGLLCLGAILGRAYEAHMMLAMVDVCAM